MIWLLCLCAFADTSNRPIGEVHDALLANQEWRVCADDSYGWVTLTIAGNGDITDVQSDEVSKSFLDCLRVTFDKWALVTTNTGASTHRVPLGAAVGLGTFTMFKRDNAAEVPGPLPTSTSIGRRRLHEILTSFEPRYRRCYNRHSTSGDEGKVVVRFIYNGDGLVTCTEVLERSTLHNGRLESCLLDTVQGIEFPKWRGGGINVVIYPFRFEAADATPAVVR